MRAESAPPENPFLDEPEVLRRLCARTAQRKGYALAAVGRAIDRRWYIAGRLQTPLPPPLTIVRRADSPLTSPEDPGPIKSAATDTQPPTVSSEGEVYLCGAETKKGTPCSRRVHGPLRCWQHKGARAMRPPEKLLIKE